MKAHSEKFLQQRRFYMVLPLLVLPFATLLFWALGGGKGVLAEAQQNTYSGLNMSLPEAIFSAEDENWNKFDLYEQAKRDSLKFQQARKNDPYYEVAHLKTSPFEPNEEREYGIAGTDKLNTSLGKTGNTLDPNEILVHQKLEELYKELDQSPKQPSINNGFGLSPIPNEKEELSSELDRMEAMMLMMQEGPDPEMQQIENVLEKILDIQHPERLMEKGKEASQHQGKQVFQVGKQYDQDNISLLAHGESEEGSIENSPEHIGQRMNGFFGLDNENFLDQEVGNAIEAVIHHTQELHSGSTVKIRLLNDVHVNGELLPKGQFIYGICQINGERLAIDIESIRTHNSIFPVSLSVYDLDGLEGIYIPGALTRDVAKQSTRQAIQGMEFNTLDPSLGAQAVDAGIQAAKSLISKKTNTIKVTVKAGYKILLYGFNAKR